MSSNLSYWEWVGGLRPELRDIVAQYWDYTGRPTSEYSHIYALRDIAILNARNLTNDQYHADRQEVVGNFFTEREFKIFDIGMLGGVAFGAKAALEWDK